MDIATLLGIIGAVAIVAMAMVLGGDPTIFINPPSLLIVIGGSMFVVLAKFSLGQFLGAVKVAAKAFAFKLESPEEIIGVLVDVAQVARKGGLLALEEKEVDNAFLKNGMQLLVDGQDREVVKTMLQKDRSLTLERHKWGAKVFTALGDVGPAMGMIGTLIGLVQMLANMDDPKSIGPAMAVALLTTLYGAMLATMICIPIADKLDLRMTEEARIQAIIIDALLAIQAGQNPRVIEDMLRNYLPAGTRDDANFDQPAAE
ncbi:flagellar motor protein PomA [Oceanospirillum sediminis]|uniref:Flagellar motor protein PomA n=1 Tax=Oceanospirillum sediminis TaxID=2760088 RepID=A0A839IN57_9GAMM|nr:flagellar motor protein PomA [Oceanospirillum sediminis]